MAASRAERPLVDLVVALLVADAALAVFLPAVGNGFVAWDDDVNFLQNSAYRGLGGAELAWMFTNFRGH
jgi:hypothetical protein